MFKVVDYNKDYGKILLGIQSITNEKRK